MFSYPQQRSSIRPPSIVRLRRLATVAIIGALAGFGGPLACDVNPFGPSAEGFREPQSRLTVEVRAAGGVGIVGVALELRGAGQDSATVYARASTGADGTVYLGEFSVLIAPVPYRLFITPPIGYALAPGQASPMSFSLTNESSNGPLGSGLYGNPARVVVQLVLQS